MAERVINKDVQFAYASDNIEIELKQELEKYFLYQTILIIDPYFEYGKVIDKLQHSTKCNIIVERKFNLQQNYDNVACIISVNSHYINDVKKLCFSKNIPYIIALTKLCDTFCFKKYAYTSNLQIISCNSPLGIMFSTDLIFEPTSFICKVVLELSSLSFLDLQNKIYKMFFSENQIYQINQKSIKELKSCLQNGNQYQKDLLQKMAKIFISYCIEASKMPVNVLDNLVAIYKNNNNNLKDNCLSINKNDYLIEIRYVFTLLITSLEKNYFDYYTNNLKDTINYNKHINYLSKLNLQPKMVYCKVPENKLLFVLSEFRSKIQNDIEYQLIFEKNIKNIIADIDIDFLYKTFEVLKELPLKDCLCLEQDIFDSQNFLSILYQCGLLNFEI